MMSSRTGAEHKILVTGATGALGKLVADQLLKRTSASSVIAGVRDRAKAADLAARGVDVRVLDYDKPETLTATLRDVDRLLLISGNAVGQRVRQHTAVIDAAKAAGVKLIGYTSVLRADLSKLGLAAEHKATESVLVASGVPFVMLRNGWYLENFAGRVPAAGAPADVWTCAGEGRFAAATREDFAAGTAAVLTSRDGYAGQKLELAGSSSFNMREFAEIASQVTGRAIACRNLSREDYSAALVKAGLPDFVAAILSDSDASAADGWLFDDSRTLEKLIGRATTPLAKVLEGARS
jgi:NAD(P)H dehydrogenase (quinone)